MDQPTLAKILQEPGWHELHSAKILGWECKMWGKYRALVRGSADNVIHGMVFEVRTSEERDSIIAYEDAYETGAYGLQDCVIDLDGRGRVHGKAFAWNGESESLREGTFD
ncbi:hypothetical protein N7508_006381 [Penicillium antarcticum]|nr:uncharacterized protein N7508_006381 [Penicillium antarcticum]KAJ5301518.1 hypothetical protein N7508_006381 [Penicillium antarcticum]